MRIYKISLSSWTASFRYPNIVSGVQPSLKAPPLSTIFGLISAAKGDLYHPDEMLKLGYYFNYDTSAWDVETIYQKEHQTNSGNSNIVKRELFFYCQLYLYTNTKEVSDYFKNPVFPLLLGRSGDLARVDKITEMETDEIDVLSNIRGTIIPFKKHQIPAPIQALPICFSDEIPRKSQQTIPFYIVDSHIKKGVQLKSKGINDPELISNFSKSSIDIYWQECLGI